MESRDLPVVAALVALTVAVALAFRQVIDGEAWIAPLIGAAAVPPLVGALVRPLRRGPWLEPLVSGAIVAAGILLLTPGGPSPGAIADRLRAGWDVLQVAQAPVPARPGVVILAALVVWAVAALTDYLAFHHDASLGALAPGVVIVIWCTALGSPDGAWLTVVIFGAAAVLFLGVQHQRLLDRHRARIGRAGRLVDAPRLLAAGVIAGVVVVAASVAVAVALPGASDQLVSLGIDESGFQGKSTYSPEIDPVLDVRDQLDRPEPTSLFTVQADEPQYWRQTAMTIYRTAQGGQWVLQADQDDVSKGLDQDVPADTLTQHFTIGQLHERWIPAASSPVSINTDDVLYIEPTSSLVTGHRSVAGLDYTVRSDVPTTDFDAETVRNANAPVPDDLDEYVELPDDLPPVIAETAQSVVGDVTNPLEQATALRDYFRNGSFTYDLNPDLGEADEDAIVRFLENRHGFCVQFATAYTLMARSLGIPARFATGFTPGALDPATGTFTVASSDAHAWPEIYLSGIGWTSAFDPTPQSSQPGGSAVPNEIPPAAPPLTQDPVPPTTVATSPPDTTPAPPASVEPDTTPGAPVPNGGGVDISAEEPDDSSPGALVWIAALVGLGLVLLLGPLLLILFLKHRRRAHRRDGDPRAAIVGAWQEAMDALTDHRVATSDAETPFELADRLPDEAGDATDAPMHSLAEAYTEARYATQTPDDAQAESAWRDVDDLEHALAQSVGFWANVRARFSPGSLVQERDHDEQHV